MIFLLQYICFRQRLIYWNHCHRKRVSNPVVGLTDISHFSKRVETHTTIVNLETFRCWLLTLRIRISETFGVRENPRKRCCLVRIMLTPLLLLIKQLGLHVTLNAFKFYTQPKNVRNTCLFAFLQSNDKLQSAFFTRLCCTKPYWSANTRYLVIMLNNQFEFASNSYHKSKQFLSCSLLCVPCSMQYTGPDFRRCV